MTSQWLQDAISQEEEPELNKDNLRHFKMAQTYIFWTYQNALREKLKGRKSIHVYTGSDEFGELNESFAENSKKIYKKSCGLH
jgi:hypothetical protein